MPQTLWVIEALNAGDARMRTFTFDVLTMNEGVSTTVPTAELLDRLITHQQSTADVVAIGDCSDQTLLTSAVHDKLQTVLGAMDIALKAGRTIAG